MGRFNTDVSFRRLKVRDIVDESESRFCSVLGFGRCKAQLEKSHWEKRIVSQTISIIIWLTSNNLLSSPTLPNRYVRPSH